MKRCPSKPLELELLEPLDFKKRLAPAMYLFVMRSRKPYTRRYIEGQRLFDLAVLLECDPTVVQYNVRVKPQPLALGGSATAEPLAPAAISLNSAQQITVHTFFAKSTAGAEDRPAEESRHPGDAVNEAWNRWAQEKGFAVKAWSRDDLSANPLLMSNRKRLLRHVSRLDAPPNVALMARAVEALHKFRKTTFFDLARRLEADDPEAANAAICALILDGRICSDIEFAKFDVTTEVSAFDAIGRP